MDGAQLAQDRAMPATRARCATPMLKRRHISGSLLNKTMAMALAAFAVMVAAAQAVDAATCGAEEPLPKTGPATESMVHTCTQ